MITEDPEKRPTVEETLDHPLFWKPQRRLDYFIKIGNQDEAENHLNADPELVQAVDQGVEKRSFYQWKSKLPHVLIQKMDGKRKAYTDSTLELLRFIRNLDAHYTKVADKDADVACCVCKELMLRMTITR
ncbi:unnamed protein product [Coregonus sp. 'balchen']|nr:unnamed protein product [Coregonus sp. 'balchen']